MKHLIKLLFVLLCLAACNEDEPNDPGQNQDVDEPAVTEVGIPLGNLVTKDIGPSGGSLTSDEGILDIIVPAGAVENNTTFSVQPIFGFCPGGLYTYRLLPEGLTFANPVTLVFHYTDEDIAGTLPELLGIAYQGADKIWYSLPRAVVDEVNKTISVEVKHFTDWAEIEYLFITPKTPTIPEVRVSETIDLSIESLLPDDDYLPPLPTSPSDNPSPSVEDELPPLPKQHIPTVKWYVNNDAEGNDIVGRISSQSGTGNVTYKAPSKAPSNNIVTVKAEITGLKTWVIEDNLIKAKPRNKVELIKQIKIKPDEYNYTLKLEISHGFACGYDGQTYQDLAEMHVKVHGMEVTVSNIANHLPSVVPSQITMPGTECTLTCLPGFTGYFNVISGAGYIALSSQNSAKLIVLTVTNEGVDGIGWTATCPQGDIPGVPNLPKSDYTSSFAFYLNDSEQTVKSDNQEYSAKLTPK